MSGYQNKTNTMAIIGRIIHDEPLQNHKKLPYFNYVEDVMVYNFDLPTLVVGWKSVNEKIKLYTHDILDRRINYFSHPFLYWEFSPKEDIVQYDQGIEQFIKKAPYLFMSQYKYVNVDPFKYNLLTLQDIENYIPEDGNLYVYKDETLYFNKIETGNRLGDEIYGFKLSVFNYLGIKPADIIALFKKKSKNQLIDSDAAEYQKYYKQFPEFGLLKRSMVVFSFF